MKKWIARVLLAALAGLLIAARPAQAQYAYTTNADGVSVTITGYTGPGGAVTIPTNINNLLVTSIGDYAFEECTSLTSVTIPASVTNIGYAAFYLCTFLTNVTIPGGVTNIGGAAFSYCDSLTAINVAANNAFFLSVAGVLFNAGETTLIEYPAGKAGTYAIPNGVTSIGAYAFSGPSLTSVTIPDSVTSIGVEAFASCTSLTNVTIGDGVTSIGDYAFESCRGLTNVTIGNSVTNIGEAPFLDCLSLTAINVDPNNPIYMSVGGILFNQGQTMLIEYPAGNPVTSYAIPNTVTIIGDYAFFYCYALTSVTIPASVTSIGEYAFEYCSSLATVTLAYGLTSIGDYAFEECTSLTSVTIPASVTTIQSYAFYYCTSLQGVYFLGNAPAPASLVFRGDNSAIAYYLPGTRGWSTVYAGIRTAPWTLPNPMILNNSINFGAQPGGFSFTVSWASNATVVVEAASNLAAPDWQPLQTNTLTDTATNGFFNFSDPDWTNYPSRFYRLISP